MEMNKNQDLLYACHTAIFGYSSVLGHIIREEKPFKGFLVKQDKVDTPHLHFFEISNRTRSFYLFLQEVK